MEYIKITSDNIEDEHICCAMSNNQSVKKKEWMKKRFEEGLVFYRAKERGKCFIEYLPVENAWFPLEAKNYMHINCMWIAGSLKGKGYSNDLLNYCIEDAKRQNKDGITILSSIKKKEFLADPKYLVYKGFKVADEILNGITLLYLPLKENVKLPKFKECAKKGEIKDKGFVIYYSDQCPFTYYWVPRIKEVAKQKGIDIKTIYIDDKEKAQNMPVPFSTYAAFKDGKFVTHGILSDKKFLKLAGVE